MVVEISGGSPVQATGRIALVPKQILEYHSQNLICSNFCKVVQARERYTYYFLQYWLYLYRNGRMFDYENSSTGLKNFDFTSFTTKEPIKLPPEDISIAFNKRIEPIYREMFNVGFEIEQLKEAQALILPQLMLR